MSIQAVSWALSREVKDPAAKLVLIALANAFNQQRQRCFPTIKQIMAEASCSERTVQRKLKDLQASGLITIEIATDGNGRQMANEYLLNLAGEGVRLTGGGCQIGTGEGVNADGGEGVICDTPNKEPEEIPEERTLGASAPSKPEEPDLFEAFWGTYPKREGPNPKKPARLAFERSLKRGNSFEGIMAATKDLAAKHPKPTRFCPQAVTWLNQDRCADFAEAKPASKPKPAWWTNPQADQDWEKILLGARLSSAWHVDAWGPPPFEAGCRVPSHLIRYDDERSWSVRKAA